MAKTNGTTATKETEVNEAIVPIRLRRLERVVQEVPIRGTTPLIVNKFSEKQKQMMLEAQQTKARAKKEPKDPVALFEASRYRLEDGADGFPATGFKHAICGAARHFEGVTMTQLKQAIRVTGVGREQLVPLQYESMRMREDAVRNATGVADLRYRAEYDGWSAMLYVVSLKGQFDEESILALVDAAGNGGVGEWRPSAPKSLTGTFGCFEVAI